jgi:small conductance mechanosensitive channel
VSAGTWDDFQRWVRGTGLEILLIILGALLLERFVHWLASRSGRRTEARIQRMTDAGKVPPTGVRQSRAVVQVVEWLVIGTVYTLATLLVLDRAGVPLAALVPTAAVIGVALGFGAQRIVQDLLAGFFLVSERQYGFGDWIRIGDVGSTTGVSGTVESLTLRTTRMRTIEGEVVTIPNGEIRQVTNLSREWSRVVVDVKVPIEEDLEEVIARMRDAVSTLGDDPAWKEYVLEAPTVLGVESLTLASAQVRVTTLTQPGQQWLVGRELRQRIAGALRDLGVTVPTTVLTE